MTPGWRAWRPALWLLAAAFAQGALASPRYCDTPQALSAAQHDRQLRFAAAVREALEASGQSVALVARSGLQLGRFGQRFSHAGVALRSPAEGGWVVRQLYYACEAAEPQLFDQGLPAFVSGGDEPDLGHLWLLLLPPPEAQQLQALARDNRRALQLLAPRYSANAHAFSTLYQNCNQWLAELLAAAWGGLPEAADTAAARAAAQRWLQTRGYEPTAFELGWSVLMWASTLVPLLHTDDHPEPDIDARRYRVSMPASIENFVHAAVPGTRRLELCHSAEAGHIVLRRGWSALAEACRAEPGDEVTVLR